MMMDLPPVTSIVFLINFGKLWVSCPWFRASEGTLSRWSRLHFAVISYQSALGPRGGL
jgi:hypothetical protein